MAQKTLEETFHATRTTDFNEAFWNKFLGDLGTRFRALETIKIDWEVVSQEGIQVALDRINEVLGPAAERVQNIAALGFLSVESESSRTLALGTVNFIAKQGDQLDLFVPTPFVAVTRALSPVDYAIGQVTYFDRETGSIDIDISYFEGDPGPHNDWTISAVAGQAIAQSSLLNQTVAARDIAVDASEDAETARAAAVVAKTAAETAKTGAQTALSDLRQAVGVPGAVPPASPNLGQLWYDTALVRIWNGASFVPVAIDALAYLLKAGGVMTGDIDMGGHYLLNSGDAGKVAWFATKTPPTGWLKANGAAISRTTYAALFKALVTDAGYTAQTFTVTIAAPGVVTKAAHGFTGGERLRLSTTGALPTGLNTTADFFVIYVDANTFRLASSAANAEAGTAITTTGAQSGTHSFLRSDWGLGDGSTTFNVPDLRGEFPRGLDDGRGIDTNRALGTYRQSQNLAHGHGVTDPTHAHTYGDAANSATGVFGTAGGTGMDGVYLVNRATAAAATGISIQSSGGTEARPRSIALLACVRY